MKVNEVYHGFRLVAQREVPELHAMTYTFTHEKSGARLFYVHTDDDNKVFSIAFRTPPKDDTGVPHVVEHSVLCGSRKFPLKEPFVELVKGSLNTFLNAMTYPDKTIYPVASRNDKDFQNLMDVYLDAVFYPAMYEKPEVLQQEGWHYEIENADEPLRYSGVVYNEMKGATSSPDDLLDTEVLKALYPDTTYHFESGGNPEHITDLTQEAFVNFHKKYYHPSNSYIYLYGDLDIDEKLAFLDRDYLSSFMRIDMDSEIPMQATFNGLRRITKEYPVGATEDTAEKTYLDWSVVVCNAEDHLLRSVMAVLSHALFATDAAPVRQALLDAGIGKDMDASFEGQVRQPFFSVEVQNAEPADAERFYAVVRETLQKLATEGIDRTLLEASLNYIEFKVREADYGQAPKGLIHNINVMTTWLYGGAPEDPLFFEEDLKTLREGLTNDLYEDVLQRYLIDNPHQILLTMKPSQTMAAAREATVEALLAEKKASMTAEEIQAIIENTAHLKMVQATPDTPEDLAKIPLLSLSDINPKVEILPLAAYDIAGHQVLFSEIATHGIVYMNFYFDADVLTAEEQLYAYLLCDVLDAVDTKQHSYTELTKLRNLHMGDLSVDLKAYDQVDDPSQWSAKGIVKVRALARKVKESFALLTEILTSSVFTDEKRMQDLVDQCVAGCERRIMNSPQAVMASRLSSYIRESAQFDDIGSLAYDRFLRDLADDFETAFPRMCENLARVMQKLYRAEGIVVFITCERTDYPIVEEELRTFFAALPQDTYKKVPRTAQTPVKNEALMTSSRVQYVGKGANFKKLGYTYTGAMRVLETIMRYGYLWTKLRVQGGAYGASAQFNPEGSMLFTSYRDPNLKETLAVYDGVADYLRAFDASPREMTKYIIGTVSGMDMPMTPQMKGNAAALRYLRGVTDAFRQARREEVLKTGVAEIRALADVVEAGMRENTYCVFGNEDKIRENGDVFSRLVKVMQ